MRRRQLFAMMLAAAAAPGCSAAAPVLSAIAQGAQWLGSVLDIADAGQRSYFNRHPNMDAEGRINEALTHARTALAALDHAIGAASAEDEAKARAEAVAAYDALRKLLDETGVLDGRPPPGGPETDAPVPKPVELPSREQVAMRLGEAAP